jgi:hypothetical protein
MTFDLIDFITARSCGSMDTFNLESAQRNRREKDNHNAPSKSIFSYVSIHPFFISPMDDIVAAHIPKQVWCICYNELVYFCIWINDYILLQFNLQQYIYFVATATFSILAISADDSLHVCMSDNLF